MQPEEISREYRGIIDELCSAVTDQALLTRIYEESDSFFRMLALSVWKTMEIAPSQACIETYGALYLEWKNKPPAPDFRELQAKIDSAPLLNGWTSPPPPYLDDLIAFDLQQNEAQEDDEESSHDLFHFDYGFDELQKINDRIVSACSPTFVLHCSEFTRHLAEVLQEPCPATVLSCIIDYWTRQNNHCEEEGAVLPPLKQLSILMQFQEQLTDAGIERLERVMSSANSPEEDAESQRLDEQNQREAARQEARQPDEQSETLEDLLDQLNGLCGLERVKKEVQNQIARAKMQKRHRDKGKHASPLSLHMVFMGNPGTGKTTVARLIGKIYHAIGILSVGQLIEVDRSGLVGEYIGQTETKTQAVINRADGGVLFIDEAYALANRGQSDFGTQAIEVLLKNMEDRRDTFLVIVAGYPEPMKQFIHSNPGLESRFGNFIHFDDYNGAELMKIFCSFCQRDDYNLKPDAASFAQSYFDLLYEKRGPNFGNGRDVRNFYERVLTAKAMRELYQPDDACDEDITMDDLIQTVKDRTETSL